MRILTIRDDGLTQDYQRGAYRETTYTARYVEDHLEVRSSAHHGKWPPLHRSIQIRCWVGGKEFDGAGADGETIVVANVPHPQ